MKYSAFTQARAACSYFFAGPGLVYGMFTSRMPALSMQTGANEAQIGLILLCFGVSGMVALAISVWLIDRFTSRTVLRISAPLLCLALPLVGMASSPLQLGLACVATGLSMGFVDVSMNTQAIQIERAFFRPCVSMMHASYSIGGVLGSLAGALFAGLGASTFINFICVLALYFSLYPLAFQHMQADEAIPSGTAQTSSTRLPLFVLLCGALSTIAYSAEGSVAEWGSLLLFSVKGANEFTAALVFGSFCTSMVIGRLAGDRLRCACGDFPLLFSGSVLAFTGMLTVLLSPWPVLCLFGYALMGLGLAPLAPIFFSRAGNTPGITPGKASAIVSFMGYSGVLVFPPSLGWLAHTSGLGTALFIIPVLCALLAAGAFPFRGGEKPGTCGEQ
ncbi:MFS transporter [Mailhella sp.]|uniref:MFS transporter n=1 Tax=Mailhella sp. TaxID=1981029 RepID=UPI0040647986